MSFKDRLSWADDGSMGDGPIRYMMIRPDALMGIFGRLTQSARGEALAALKASIKERGGQSAAAYVATQGRERLLKVIEETAPQLGWGTWSFRDGGPQELVVKNSPFAAASTFGGPACHAISGMMEAVASIWLERDVAAREVECAADGAPLCRFRLTDGATA
ncbi:MAG: 4-vinyl reductase [Pseudomonadota bacterium]